MIEFSYEDNCTDNLMVLPIPIGNLCWSIDEYHLYAGEREISGFTPVCGHYCGSVCVDFRSMKFKHYISFSNGDIKGLDCLFKSEVEADDFIKLNNRSK